MWTSSAVGKLVVNFSRYLGHRASARLTLLAVLSISLLLFCQTALAQAVYGSIIGTITDSTGAVVPNATVTVTDTAKGTSTTVQSDADGQYRAQHLIPDTFLSRYLRWEATPKARPVWFVISVEDFAHFLPDTRTIGLGVQVGKDGWEELLATNTEAFVNNFVNRAEFHAAYDNLSNADYVDTLISHTGVSFTAAERDALLSGLGAGSMTRAEALTSIAGNSRFVSAKFNETFVMMEYFGYLRRDADASGFAFWLNKLNEFNGNFEQAEMVKAFIVSGEYRDRFPR